MRITRFGRARLVLMSSVVLGLLITSLATGAVSTTSSNPIAGAARNPRATVGFTRETQIIGTVAQHQGGFAAGTGGFVTRQSNRSDSGGGAIYGCRAKPGTEACVAANNLNGGEAFRLQSTVQAATLGQLRFGLNIAQLVPKPPFQTNGTGMVTNLNADMVDGQHAADFVSKDSLLFAVVGTDGSIGASRGVPPGVKATVTTSAAGNEEFTVPVSGDVSKCAYTATPQDVNAPTIAVALGTDHKSVVVREKGSTAFGFHLQVTC